MLNHIRDEAVRFFREERGFHRLLRQFIKKYRSLGRVGGTVTLTSLKSDEKEALSTFFRKDYSKQKSVTVSLEKFNDALQKTKFAGLDVKDILDGFQGESVLSKQEEVQTFENEKATFFDTLRMTFTDKACQRWLNHIVEKRAGTRGIHAAYAKDPKQLKTQLEHILTALTQLPISTGYERLPLFASRITGDPHGFDMEREQGRFFVHALQTLRQENEPEYDYLSSPTAEQMTDTLQFVGLVRDDILNFATCAGIVGYTESDSPIPVWHSANEEKNVLNVPLREIVKAKDCVPNLTKIVFIVENSGVFSSILDEFQEGPWPPLVCTHGQFKLATLLLLDKVAEHGTTIYYSGDFDPEGLQMAQRMIRRYPSQVRLWRYGCKDYWKTLSEIDISESRLKKLRSIRVPELTPVAEEMLRKEKPAYQEELVSKLAEDIRQLMEYSKSGLQ